MFQKKRYPNYRTVSSTQNNGFLLIKIDPVSNRNSYVIGLIILAGVFVFCLWNFTRAFFQARPLIEDLYGLLPIIFLFICFMVGLRSILEPLCAIELSVEKHIFRWKYKIWHWHREISSDVDAVEAVTAKVRWYANRLDIRLNGRTYSLRNLLDDDIHAVERELRRTLGFDLQ